MFLRILFYLCGLPIFYRAVSFVVGWLFYIPVKKLFKNKISQIKYLNFFRLSISAIISLHLVIWLGETYLRPPSFVLLTVPSIIILYGEEFNMKKLYYLISFDESWIPDPSLSDEGRNMLRSRAADSMRAWYVYGVVLGFPLSLVFLYKYMPFWL